MVNIRHDDFGTAAPVGSDKIFFRDVDDFSGLPNGGIGVTTVDQMFDAILALKGAEIKSAYEGETNTNAFTDAEKAKLGGISPVAEPNPDVVPQAEAEAGVATTERIWTAERVAQAIAALAGGGGGSVTEGNLRAVIASLTAAAPDTADTFGYVDAGSPGQMGQATAAQIVTKGNSDLGIVPQKRIETTVDPTVNDDSGSGYAVNDLWTNTTTDNSWICQDSTTGAAVWTQIDGGGGGGDLWSDVVDADIVPDADGTRDLGADATRFAQAYIDELHSTGGLLVTESADHTNTPAAGKGEFWVKNDAPCTPVFTDDDGVDHDLTLGEWHTALGDLPSGTSFPSGTDRNLYFIVPYDCTLKEIRWWADRAVGADASNYWTLMPQRIASGSNVDLLDAAWDNSGGLAEHLSYDLGTITTNGTDAQLSKGDVVHCVYTTVGTPSTNFFGGRCAYMLYLEPR